MNNQSFVTKLLEKIKKTKHIEIIIAVIAIVIMLFLYFSSKIIPSSTKDKEELSYCEVIEKNLTEVLSKVKDAGQVRVIINWDSCEPFTKSSSKSNDLFGGDNNQNTGDIINPKPIGVIIICQGGNNIKVKIEITNAVSTFLCITTDKITILTMNVK